MTESIFDPTGGQTEHSGSRNLGPAANNNSHMPPDVVDGVVEEDEFAPDTSEALEEIAAAEEIEETKKERPEGFVPDIEPGREPVD